MLRLTMRSASLSRRQLILAASASPLVLAACKDSAEPSKVAAARLATAPDRDVVQVLPSMPTTDGAGVKLKRAMGHRGLSMLDPFLMLDEFLSERGEDYIKGFPEHPHRGFETVTYMIHGAMEHKDSLGNRGRLGPGSVQWMTAGHGIVHSEMPKQQDGLMWGFQLWVNLPARNKMVAPRYQDIEPERVAETLVQDAAVRVVVGEVGGVRGPVDGIATAPQMLDVKVPRKGRFRHALPTTHNVFAYVFDGAVRLGRSAHLVQRGNIVVFGPGEAVSASSDDGGRFLLLAGQPINEPVARSGPFVMNTDDELQQAWRDYREGRLATRIPG